jgi:hypothetical protein
MSCQSWSSVEVTYVHPPQVSVRKMPTAATNLGRVELGRRVKMYHRPTRANRGPGFSQRDARAEHLRAYQM